MTIDLKRKKYPFSKVLFNARTHIHTLPDKFSIRFNQAETLHLHFPRLNYSWDQTVKQPTRRHLTILDWFDLKSRSKIPGGAARCQSCDDRPIEYLTAMINGAGSRLKVMVDRPTHTCIPGNRRLSVPADKTGSRARTRPSWPNVRDATTHGGVHGVARRGVAWRYRGMRGGSRLCMLAASVATRRTFPALRCDVTIRICRPEEHVCPSSSPLSSSTTRELISDFSSIFPSSFHSILVVEKTIID